MSLSRRLAATAIAVTIVLQLAIASSSAVRAWYIEKNGQEIVVAARAYDPRSLFRGNFARVNYDFSRIRRTALPSDFSGRAGAPVYVLLTQGADGRYAFESAHSEYPVSPSAGVVLRGRVPRGCQRAQGWAADSGRLGCRVEYGIEAFFAPKDEALELEQTIRKLGADAVIRVADSGQAILVRIDERSKP